MLFIFMSKNFYAEEFIRIFFIYRQKPTIQQAKIRIKAILSDFFAKKPDIFPPLMLSIHDEKPLHNK
jgi:hypothetical protein